MEITYLRKCDGLDSLCSKPRGCYVNALSLGNTVPKGSDHALLWIPCFISSFIEQIKTKLRKD